MDVCVCVCGSAFLEGGEFNGGLVVGEAGR